MAPKGSLFTDDEVRGFTQAPRDEAGGRGRLVDQSWQAHSTVVEDGLGATRRGRNATVIDDTAVLQMMQDATPDQRRFAMDPRLRKVFILLIAFVIVYVSCLILPDHIVSAVANQSTRSFAEVVQSNFENLAQVLSGKAPNGLEYSSIVIMLLIALVGAGLATVGASYQVTFRNQLATPSSLGVMSGAAVGMAVFYMMKQDEAARIAARVAITQEQVDALSAGVEVNPLVAYLDGIEGALYSMVGAFAVVALTVIIAKIAGHGKLNNAVLIIAGQVFASIANAFIVLFRLYLESTGGQDAVSGFAMAQTGDLTGIGRTLDLAFMGLPIIVAMVVLFLIAPRMNAIAFVGDDARTLGLKVDGVRIAVVVLSTIVTAIIVSFVGSIGFVGFAIPQIVRRFVGPDFRYLLPASALAGASFLLIVNFAYSSITLTSGGIGVVTSLIGGVVFIISVFKQRMVPQRAA